MKNNERTYNYALALFSLAYDRKIEEGIYKDLTTALKVFGSGRRFETFFYNPSVSFNDKEELLKKAFRIDPLALHFIFVLMKNKALGLIKGITIKYKELMDISHNIEQVKVTSASILEEEKQTAIKKRLDKTLNKDTACKFDVDPGLIAGFTIEYGDNLLDGSIKRQLKTIRERLSTN
ncbi:MAG: ATP synthase F1 subunit delta [Elusimicrobia bacterium]|nr:ATP synthase F1 subunit delta [Candidatus Liberimonas magnetica]